jgi:hypothetical protein
VRLGFLRRGLQGLLQGTDKTRHDDSDAGGGGECGGSGYHIWLFWSPDSNRIVWMFGKGNF